MKNCTVCKTYKGLENFYNYKASPDGLAYRCKDCDGKARKKWRENNPVRSSESARGRNLKHKYGITLEDYKSMLEDQGGVCAICGVSTNKTSGRNGDKLNFAVDHCHTTGNVRGLLCNQCNRGLGMLMDSAETLEKALSYLKKYNETH